MFQYRSRKDGKVKKALVFTLLILSIVIVSLMIAWYPI